MRGSRLLAVVDAVVLALACATAALIAMAWAVRMPHPYDLEWMEGGMLAHAWRLREGLPIYPEPGPDFVPFVYPPGYPALLALLSTAFELGHPLGRAVSVVGTLAAAAALGSAVWRHGRSPVVAAGAAAVFLGTWPDSGTFFDLVRPDALSLGFLAWALALGLERGRAAVVASGLLLAAAFLCKHNAAAYGLPLLLGVAARDGWRRGALFAAASAGPAALATLALQVATDGRFLRYVLGVPGSHPMVGDRIWPGTPGELVDALPVALPVVAAGVLWRARAGLRLGGRPLAVACGLGAVASVASLLLAPWPRGVARPGTLELAVGGAALGAGLLLGAWALASRRGALPWRWVLGGGVAVTALVTAGLMRGHHGGFVNVLMPLHWVTALGVGLVVARLRAEPRFAVAASGLLAAQLGLQLWQLDAQRFLPTADDRAAGDRVVALVRERCRGPVLSPLAAWLPAQAGFEPSVHLIALWDIDHPRGPFRDDVARIEEAVASGYWDCALLGGRAPGFGLSEHYRRVERLPLGSRDLTPRAGWRARPTDLLVPR